MDGEPDEAHAGAEAARPAAVRRGAPAMLRLAGVVAWLSTGVPPALRLAAAPAVLRSSWFISWLAGFAVFGVAFWRSSAAAAEMRSDPKLYALLALQSVAALLMLAQICTGLESVLLILVAAQLGFVSPRAWAALWISVQTLFIGWLSASHWSGWGAFRWTAATFGFQVLAALLAGMAHEQWRARERLARANSELRAARVLLAERSRLSERVEIARELHDVLGHDLTALSLQLELAGHFANEPVREHVGQARSIAKRLLGDVRQVVSTMRQGRSAEVAAPIRELIEGVVRPAVHTNLADSLSAADAVQAHAIVRCVQEALTNVLRHAGASNVWVDVAPRDGGIAVDVRDDGRGAPGMVWGQGLLGMRERFAAMGGRLDIKTGPRSGFHLSGWLPLEGSA